MRLTQHDDLVQAFATDHPNQPVYAENLVRLI
jgi:hypothetical protein